MTHNPANYQQDYQNYYQDVPDQYADYGEDENQVLEEEEICEEDPLNLQVPNPRLYAEGYPDVTELYARNAPLMESQQQVENIPYREEYTPGPNDYYYESAPHSQPPHRTKVPKTQRSPMQSTSNYHYPHHHLVYPPCPLTTSHSLQGPSVKQTGVNYASSPGLSKNFIQEGNNNNLNLEGYNQHQDMYEKLDRIQRSQQIYGDYVMQYGSSQEGYNASKGKKINLYAAKMGRSGGMRKYPITVKTPKYVTKNQIMPSIIKRPSALCLKVGTQPDPGLVRRKSKTHHHIKRANDQSEPLPRNPNDSYPYSAHQVHSEGDMNQTSVVKSLDNLLDQFEDNVVLRINQDNADGEEQDEETKTKIKEFSKFLKPRIPASIKAKQEKVAQMKAALNMSENAIRPKMKLSLDKLLNRLQNCEGSESGEKLSEKSKKEDKKEKSKEKTTMKLQSFNYETLSRKLSPTIQREDEQEEVQSKNLLHKPSTSLTTSLDNKPSRLMRPLDDHCALDLHRSKSYIVDLIDRALSKELGTVPRGQSIHHDMTPKHAVNTISRHRQSAHKELCYEVTAALTDSFISNATAPPKQHKSMELKRNQSAEDDAENKICRSMSDDLNYIKHLKQLRWGHIRHIQHEAKKLADLEEFLEKCGEIDY